MWPTIDRARRRISGGPPVPGDGAPAPAPTPAPETIDDVIVLAGQGVDRLGEALRSELGRPLERLDTPHRIEHALATLIARRDGFGHPRVLRRPAGLSSPEAWEIHLDGVGRATSEAVRDASRSGSFER